MRMKYIVLIIAVTALLYACGKSNETTPRVLNPDNEIEGTWLYTENYISPGSPWHWIKVKDGGTVTIKKDSTYEIKNKGNTREWPFPGNSDAGKIGTFYNKKFNQEMTYILPKDTKDTTFIWPLIVKNDTLEIALPCFEGCIYRFKKI